MYDFAFWGKAIEKKLTNSMKIHVFRMIEFFFEDIFGAAILFTGLYLYKYSTIPYFFAVFQQSNGIFLRRSKFTSYFWAVEVGLGASSFDKYFAHREAILLAKEAFQEGKQSVSELGTGSSSMSEVIDDED